MNFQIFCVHGGLSPSIQTLDQIRTIDRKQEVRDTSHNLSFKYSKVCAQFCLRRWERLIRLFERFGCVSFLEGLADFNALFPQKKRPVCGRVVTNNFGSGALSTRSSGLGTNLNLEQCLPSSSYCCRLLTDQFHSKDESYHCFLLKQEVCKGNKIWVFFSPKRPRQRWKVTVITYIKFSQWPLHCCCGSIIDWIHYRTYLCFWWTFLNWKKTVLIKNYKIFFILWPPRKTLSNEKSLYFSEKNIRHQTIKAWNFFSIFP